MIVIIKIVMNGKSGCYKMNKYNIDYSSDGCPNDCNYCRVYGYPCVYKDSNSPLAVKPYTCCKCGKKLTSMEAYELKGRYYCEDCFD